LNTTLVSDQRAAGDRSSPDSVAANSVLFARLFPLAAASIGAHMMRVNLRASNDGHRLEWLMAEHGTVLIPFDFDSRRLRNMGVGLEFAIHGPFQGRRADHDGVSWPTASRAMEE
jgi:hypothetical protein